MGSELSNNHIALVSSTQVAEICKPLKKLGISYFSFVRSFKDGSHIRLANNAAWTQHYYTREFYNVIVKQIPDKEGNILWSCMDRYPLFYEASEYFDVDNGTAIVITTGDVVERYFFGSTKENIDVNHVYLHHLDLLKKFILYFKEIAKPLIDKATETKILVPQRLQRDEDVYADGVIKDFLNDIKITKVSIRVKGKDIFITPNEAKILSLMKYGYTAKDISKEIGLKSKTIEIYRDNLKLKLNQFTRGNLVSLANSNSLLEIDLLNDNSLLKENDAPE